MRFEAGRNTLNEVHNRFSRNLAGPDARRGRPSPNAPSRCERTRPSPPPPSLPRPAARPTAPPQAPPPESTPCPHPRETGLANSAPIPSPKRAEAMNGVSRGEKVQSPGWETFCSLANRTQAVRASERRSAQRQLVIQHPVAQAQPGGPGESLTFDEVPQELPDFDSFRRRRRAAKA